MGRLIAIWHSAYNMTFMIGSVRQYSRSGIPDSLRHHRLQHTRLPCPSPTPGACSNLCPLSWWCHPTISSSVTPSPPAFNLSQHQCLFQWVSSSHQVLELQFQHWSFQWIFRVDFFRIDCFDHLAVQGTLKSLLQHHSTKASILWCLAVFMVQFSHLYMATGNTIGLTRWTFVGKATSLLCNILSRFVIAFLPRSKCLLISWLQSLHSDFVAQENKVSPFPLFSHLFTMKWWDQMPWS